MNFSFPPAMVSVLCSLNWFKPVWPMFFGLNISHVQLHAKFQVDQTLTLDQQALFRREMTYRLPVELDINQKPEN